MKCIYCGAEIRKGGLYCSNCGKSVQIVPDYNEYEEDYLKQVLAEENIEKTDEADSKKNKQHEKNQKKHQKKIILGVVGIIVVLVLILIVLGAAVRSNHNNSFSYQVEQAEKAYASGDIDKAISYYENALSLDQSSIDVRLTLAAIYEEKGDLNSALVLYQEVLNLKDSNKEACERLIAIYEQQNNIDAIVALSSSVDKSLMELFSDYIVEAPEFDLSEGTFDTVQTLTLSSADGYDIYYTLDGGDPSVQGIHYSSPIELNENNKTYTVKAVCVNSKKIYSDIVSKEYTLELAPPDMPIVTPDGGDFGARTTVTVTVPDGCTAYYSWSSATPSTASSRYSGPIEIPEGNNVLSVILYDNTTGLYSEVYRGNYVYYDESDDGENVEEE